MRVLRMIGLLSCLACRAGVHFRLYQGVFAQFRGLNTSSMCRICLDSVSFARRAVVDDLAGRSSCLLLISRGISCYEVLLLRPPPERRDPRYDDLTHLRRPGLRQLASGLTPESSRQRRVRLVVALQALELLDQLHRGCPQFRPFEHWFLLRGHQAH